MLQRHHRGVLGRHGQRRERGRILRVGCRTRRAARGFTLTELTVLMVVVSILSGVAVASLSGLSSSQENVAATRIRTTLRFAQEWAMGSSNATWVSFDVGGDLVSVYVEDPSNPGTAGRLTLADPLSRSAMTLQLGADGIGLESASFGATTEVQFDSLGAPYDANAVALASDGTVGITGGTTIRVTRNTGLVSVD